MISLDIIVGHYFPSLFGWFFLIFVLSAESLLLTKYLKKIWYNRKIYFSVILSNVITTIIGFILLDEEKIGGHLLNWTPVNYHWGKIVYIDRTIFLFIYSFIGTLIVETLINTIVLGKIENKKRIFYGTFFVNVFTYVIGAFIILLYTVYDN